MKRYRIAGTLLSLLAACASAPAAAPVEPSAVRRVNCEDAGFAHDLLRRMGLHPCYVGRAYSLPGKRALIITTSHGVLGASGKKTGVYASEMTVPYYEFLAAGMTVDVASIRGGAIPIEPMSLDGPVMTAADKTYLSDPIFQRKVTDSVAVGAVDVAGYDLIYLAGGWGAAYDLGASPELGRQISAAYREGRIIGGVCHGPLGLLRAVDEAGAPLVRGRRLTAVTDKQVRELGITQTPMHPERELRAAGARFESETALLDIFANHVVVDGRLVTGQNQNAGAQVAHEMMRLLASAPTK